MGGPKIPGEEKSSAKARLADHKANAGCGSSIQLKRSLKAATNTMGGTHRLPSQRALQTERRGLGVPKAKGTAAEQLQTGEWYAQICVSEGLHGCLNEDSLGGWGGGRMEGERPLATAAIQKKGKGTLGSRGRLTQEVFMCFVFFFFKKD